MVATAVRASYTTAGFAPGATTNTRNVRDCDIDRRFGSFNSALLIRTSGSVVELSGEVAETVPLVVAVSRRIKVAGNCSCNRDTVLLVSKIRCGFFSRPLSLRSIDPIAVRNLTCPLVCFFDGYPQLLMHVSKVLVNPHEPSEEFAS
jgi:hypothetical protein